MFAIPVNMRMKRWYWMVGCVLIVLNSCSTNGPVPVVPPAPGKTQSAVPGIRQVNSGVNATINSNVRLGIKVDDQKKTIEEQKKIISEVLIQAENIKKKALEKQYVSEQESKTLITALKDVETRNTFLETQNTELGLVTKEQEETLKIVGKDLAKAQEDVLTKEAETDQLRVQNTYLSTNLVNTNKSVEKLKSDLSAEKQKVSRYAVYRNWVIGLAVAFILWLVIKNVLVTYFPAARFRI